MKRLLIICAWTFILFTQFAWTSSCNLFKPKSSYYKPSGQKLNLPVFKALSEAVSEDHFEKTKGRSMDSNGVYMTNSKYHPVGIFQYGIFEYDMYMRTGDKKYRQNCVNQFGYFLDSTLYDRSENCGIGFPYEITYADLKPIWYSGLAQAEGIMYLIRYYNLTGDARALPLIQDVKRFMLTPVEQGGTLRKLSDKELWIEEYANSKSRAEVINGFVTSIMGLREYTLLFPDDEEAKDVLKKCVYTHKKWLNRFDSGTGILYDQGSKSPVNDYYSKFQVIQMKQMFELFADTFYKNVEMLWATYAYGKGDAGYVACLLTDTNFSSPAVLKDGWYTPSANYRDCFKLQDVDTILTSNKLKKSLQFMVDKKPTTYPFTPDDTLAPPYIQVNLKKTVSAAGWWIQATPEFKSTTSFKFYIRDNDNSSWKRIKTVNTRRIENKYFFSFDKEKFKQYKIEFYGLAKKATVSISEINLIVPESEFITHFSHVISNEFQVTDSTRMFSFAKKNVDDFIVFYKTADVREKLLASKWNVDDGIRSNTFKIPKGKFCRFLVIFKNNSPDSAIGPITN